MRWYDKVSCNRQGLVIEEVSGRTVAVVFDDKDTALLAAAPDLLAELEVALEIIKNEYPPEQWKDYRVDRIEEVISRSKGE